MLGANSGPELSARGSGHVLHASIPRINMDLRFLTLVRMLFYYRTKPAECEGVPCSQEAEVSIPGGARGRSRKSGGCSAEGARDGESYS